MIAPVSLTFAPSEWKRTMPLIDVGKKAPAFTLPDQHGQKHRLSQYAGRAVVLFFYPKDDTPGCTKEACGFRDSMRDFEKAGVVVLGVSPQGVDSKRKFAEKFALTFPLLADEPGDEGPGGAGGAGAPPVCDDYGVWQEKSMYGKKYMGASRVTYLIGPDGRVARRWDKVKPETHAEEVLEAIRELNAVAR